MKKIKGSALVDYIIPTLVIGVIAGSGVYSLHSSGVLKNFIGASLNINFGSDGKGVVGKTTASSDAIATITPPKGFDMTTVKAGDLGGTPEQPIKSCIGNSCAIDFGELILTDVPENFGAFVETNGSSGGTEQLTAMLLQIADQIDDPSTPVDEAADLRDLANLGHFVAANIYENEDYLEKNIDSVSLSGIFLEYQNLSATYPVNLTGVINNTNLNIAELIPGALEGPSAKTLGEIRALKNEGSVLYSMHTDDHPLYAMIEKYDAIKKNSDPKYTDTVKAITEQLFLDLDRVIFDYQDRNQAYISQPMFPPEHKSPISGLKTGETPIYTLKNPDGTEKSDSQLAKEIIHPQSSIFTDIDSALICTTGKFDDTGTACK